MKWWFPARWFGIRHKHTFIDGMTSAEREDWKRQKDEHDATMSRMIGFEAQPRYERIVRIEPMRFGMTVRETDGSVSVHDLGLPSGP